MIDYDLGAMSDRLLYQVTLASGRIATGPHSFGEDEERAVAVAESYFRPVFSEDGRLLTLEADGARRAAASQSAEA